ncbi:MAG: AbrB/MazE/SpoVT family DNA-binding domain-containing protein [Rhodospirillaceae bacterium]
MGTMLTVTSKGQVTLRKEVLEHLGIGPGDRLAVEMLPDGRVEVRASKGNIDGFFGSLSQPGTATLTISEMNQIAADGWAGQR